MKNIHVLATDKPSRLVIDTIENKLYYQSILHNKTVNVLTQHIYITNDEEIKEGDWYLNTEEKNGNMNPFYGKLYKCNKSINKVSSDYIHNLKKIILTTDEKLITEGVQPIDEEFLEWFVNNSSCEEVEVKPLLSNNGRALFGYKIIIPKEEPKQFSMEADLYENHCIVLPELSKPETVEEVANKSNGYNIYAKETKAPIFNEGFIDGAKWQEKKMYTEQDIRFAYMQGFSRGRDNDPNHLEEYVTYLKNQKNDR